MQIVIESEKGNRGVAPPARIGPNSLIQTLRALRELEPPELAEAVPARAGLPAAWPEGMIPEEWFVRLVRALRETLPAKRSDEVLRRAGRYTADYVGQHRIPAPIRVVLRVLPARLGIPLLLRAFRRHAWTFAGAGHFSDERGAAMEPAFASIFLDGCPTCRAESAAAVADHAGAYYEAAFEGLLRLAAPHALVREVACQAGRAPRCRFLVFLGPSPADSLARPVHSTAPGERPCASS